MEEIGEMNLFVQKIINSVIQIVLFTLIPFLWWLATARKKESFFQWIGLKSIETDKKNTLAIQIAVTTGVFLIISALMLYSTRDIETATSEFSGLGFIALPSIVIYAVLNTAFPEEILFRGFILKRVAHRFGFTIGNIVQSVLFGLLHGFLFFSLTGVFQTILIILFTGGIGWSMGFINEKKSNGSILPSWGIHAVANLFSGICSAFLLF